MRFTDPERTHIENLAAWGQPPPPDEVPDRWNPEEYDPGPAPWAAPERRGMPAWAWVAIILGVVSLLCGSAVALAALEPVPRGTSPRPAVQLPVGPDVQVSGSCRQRIIGGYGLVASVTAKNHGDEIQRGQVWVRWKITGEAPKIYAIPATLAPGGEQDHHVNEEVSTEQWYRVQACDYGWTPAT